MCEEIPRELEDRESLPPKGFARVQKKEFLGGKKRAVEISSVSKKINRKELRFFRKNGGVFDGKKKNQVRPRPIWKKKKKQCKL